MLGKLLADVTAEMLEMDADSDVNDGYPGDFVLGPKGSTVQIDAENGDEWVCSGFSVDANAYGFVPKSMIEVLEQPNTKRAVTDARAMLLRVLRNGPQDPQQAAAKLDLAALETEVEARLSEIAARYNLEADDLMDAVINAETGLEE